MKAKVLKIMRVLRADDLRRLCVDKGYYTIGDNETYMNMFNVFFGERTLISLDSEKISSLAGDILAHTDEDVFKRYRNTATCYNDRLMLVADSILDKTISFTTFDSE